MAILVDGSKMRSDAYFGQNGSNKPSSIQKGEKIARSAVAKTIIAGDGSVRANPGSWQQRTIDAKPIKTTPGMRSRSGEGGKVPGVTTRRANDSVVRPTR
jgi:hypothetical protein